MYIRSIIIGFFIGYILFVSAVLWQMGVITNRQVQWLNDIYQIKSNYAELSLSPKIVIVSGSNGLFGISCKQIEQFNNISCVNGATHAGLGVDYLLYTAKKWSNPNDIILLPLEYSHYSSNQNISTLMIDYVFSANPQYFWETDLINKFRMINGVSLYRIKRGIQTKLGSKIRGFGSSYSKKNLNKYGDETSNKKETMMDKQKKRIKAIVPNKISINYLKNTQGMKSIEKFVYYCRENNIQVLATWPNLLWFDVYDETKKEEIQSIRDFYKKLQVPLLGKPDYFRDKELFYDTEYHLNDEGVKIRTAQLIELLKPYIDSKK